MVRWHGHFEEKMLRCKNLCRPEAIEQICASPLPRVDDTLAQLTGATTFSKLDAISDFWQVPLSDESKLLTTFITFSGVIVTINCLWHYKCPRALPAKKEFSVYYWASKVYFV